MTAVALMFPGQGSQKVGMGLELRDAFAEAQAVFEEADEVLGFSVSKLCFEGPADELMLTANTQPAILTCSIAALRALVARVEVEPKVALGHSLGEFSALVAVGALRFSDALRLVRARGEAMQEAVPAGVGAMAAVMGIAAEDLEALCTELAQGQVLSPANENGGGQIVVAGHADAVGRLVTAAKERNARAIPLKVSAPFHCALMQPAADRLEAALASVPIGVMSAPVISNVEATPNDDPGRVKELLVAQVTSRVRWEASVTHAATQMGLTAAYEVGHGKVLTGLVKRIAKELTVHLVGTRADIDVLKSPADGNADGSE